MRKDNSYRLRPTSLARLASTGNVKTHLLVIFTNDMLPTLLNRPWMDTYSTVLQNIDNHVNVGLLDFFYVAKSD